MRKTLPAAAFTPWADTLRIESARQEGGQRPSRSVIPADNTHVLSVALSADHADAAGRFCWKQSRHNTGRPCVGLNGTVVCLPHCEHTARVSVLEKP